MFDTTHDVKNPLRTPINKRRLMYYYLNGILRII